LNLQDERQDLQTPLISVNMHPNLRTITNAPLPPLIPLTRPAVRHFATSMPLFPAATGSRLSCTRLTSARVFRSNPLLLLQLPRTTLSRGVAIHSPVASSGNPELRTANDFNVVMIGAGVSLCCFHKIAVLTTIQEYHVWIPYGTLEVRLRQRKISRSRC